MDTVYLVDGSGYIFRAYYAIAPLSNGAGLPTNALLGFTRMLMKLLREEEAKYIGVTFDPAGPTFRHECYPEYKANRAECPEDLVPQMPYFRRIVEAFGIRSFEMPGFEADDVIATLTKSLQSANCKVCIVSGDKDLTQLVSTNVQMWDAMRDIRFDEAKVEEKFGVPPSQIIDYLALTGDSSDNIPGVKGIGPKTAVQLVKHFGEVEKIIEKASEIEGIEGLRGAKSVRKKIELAVEELRLSKELVCLDYAVKPFNEIKKVEELAWHKVEESLAEGLFQELEFSSVLQTLNQEFSAKFNSSSDGSTDSPSGEGLDFVTLSSESLPAFVADLEKQKAFAFDTETSSLDVLECHLVGISISWAKGKAYYLPLWSEVDKDALLDAEEVRRLLNPIFSNPEIHKCGQNLKFDIGVLEQHGYTIRGIHFDSMLASYVLNPDKRQHGLKALARNCLQVEMITFEQLLEEHKHIAQVPLERVSRYACHDAEVSWRLYETLSQKLDATSSGEEAGLRKVFQEIEMPLVHVLSEMERAGIELDLSFLETFEVGLQEDIQSLEKKIVELAGQEFNLNSPKQLAEVLFENLGIPTEGIKKTKSGYSTDARVLAKLASEYEIVSKILEYRELFKLQTTYVEALRRLVKPQTSRIHSSFNQAVAATGRLSSSDPNMQNIPIRTARGRMLRDAFIAKEGSLLLSADYSQIELRVLAHLSADENLCAAFHSGEDIHLRTAKEIFGALSSEEELKEYRQVAKTINFGIIYGMSAFRLANQLRIRRGQAQDYIDEYFARYPKVRKYFDSLEMSVEEQGYVETLFGRRRYVKEIDTSGRDAGYARRSLINAPIQGSAAEIIKLAMVNIYGKLMQFKGDTKMVLQVHDELVLEVKEELASSVKDLVVKEMEHAVELAVPLTVDVRLSGTWGGAH